MVLILNSEIYYLSYLSIRFIYGKDTDFGKASQAIEVYRFADEMQLKVLMAAVVRHFENLDPKHVLASYEFFRNVKYDPQQLEKNRLVI
jgi:hypothetical protein